MNIIIEMGDKVQYFTMYVMHIPSFNLRTKSQMHSSQKQNVKIITSHYKGWHRYVKNATEYTSIYRRYKKRSNEATNKKRYEEKIDVDKSTLGLP